MATSDNRIARMVDSFAWGAPSVFRVDDRTIWGCQFELLPGGSMLNAACTLQGVIGLDAIADPDGAEPIYRTAPGASLSIYATADTEAWQLIPYQDAVVESYRQHMSRLGMAIGA